MVAVKEVAKRDDDRQDMVEQKGLDFEEQPIEVRELDELARNVPQVEPVCCCGTVRAGCRQCVRTYASSVASGWHCVRQDRVQHLEHEEDANDHREMRNVASNLAALMVSRSCP